MDSEVLTRLWQAQKTEEFEEEGCEKYTALVERGTAEQVSQKVTEV